jgi:hypothetical protein
MKKYLLILICFAGLAVSCNSYLKDPPPKAQTTMLLAADVGQPVAIIRAVDETSIPVAPVPQEGVLGFVKNNAAELVLGLLGFLKIIVNLTPTEKDNKVFGLLDNFINWLVPNFKAGGGKFT